MKFSTRISLSTTLAFFLLLAMSTSILYAQTNILNESEAAKTERMQWFKDAKLGIFVHWGIYAVDGIDESWSFHNNYISYTDYMKQLDGFTGENYDADEWANLFKEAGAKYAVLTTKHHDGVALWDTNANNRSTVKATPFAKDAVTPFVNALRQNDLKVGLYYSHLDWSHEDYPKFTRDKNRYNINDNPERWNRFLKFHRTQLKEIVDGFKPDLLWFDGDWDYSANQWNAKEMRQQLAKWQPSVIVNSRINGYGDYATPEQGLPIYKPAAKYWELCMTINNSWGYQKTDNQTKTANQVIRIFADVISNGGNLLLDVGPKADGSIPEAQKNVLKELGRWTTKHAEAIYGTQAGIPKEHYFGPSTLSEDGTKLYLFVPHKPNGPIILKGLMNKINRIWVLGKGNKLQHKVVGKQYWSPVPGIVYIDLPEYTLDSQVTVVCVLLDGPVKLYKDEVAAIESN